MPIWDCKCEECGAVNEYFYRNPTNQKKCCRCGSEHLKKLMGSLSFKMGYPLWVDRIDEVQRRQEDKGITPDLPHPREVRAT